MLHCYSVNVWLLKMEGLKTNLLIEVDRTMAEGDTITKAVFASGPAELPIQPDILAFGVRVKAR